MKEDFYFDTSIWLDIYEKRGYNGKVAKKLLKKIIEEDCIVIYSDLIKVELKRLGYSKNEINVIFNIAKPDNLRRVHIYEKQIDEARKLAKQRDVPKKDALHAVISRDNNVQLVSKDYHFEKLKDITIYRKPEDFI